MSDRLARERKETDALLSEALRLGVEIPRNPGWWWEDVDNFGGSLQDWEFVRDDYTYLTEIGKSGARRQIREELNKLKEEMRKDIAWQRQETQWKLTIVGLIIGWLLGALGILIAVLRR
jgi:hypothetical protein